MDRPCWDFCSEPRLDCCFLKRGRGGSSVHLLEGSEAEWGLGPCPPETRRGLPPRITWGCGLMVCLQGKQSGRLARLSAVCKDG